MDLEKSNSIPLSPSGLNNLPKGLLMMLNYNWLPQICQVELVDCRDKYPMRLGIGRRMASFRKNPRGIAFAPISPAQPSLSRERKLAKPSMRFYRIARQEN
jgi:hypothetical protein